MATERSKAKSGSVVATADGIASLTAFFDTKLHDVVVLTGWRRFELHRIPPLRKAMIRFLKAGGRVNVLIGGVMGASAADSQSFCNVLLDIKDAIRNPELERAFQAGNLKISTDLELDPKVHAKVWLGYRTGMFRSGAIGSFNLSCNSFTNSDEAVAILPDDMNGLKTIGSSLKFQCQSGIIVPQDFNDVAGEITRERNKDLDEKNVRKFRKDALSIFDRKKRRGSKRKKTIRSTTNGPKTGNLSEHYIVLKDLRKGEKTKYSIPESILTFIYGSQANAKTFVTKVGTEFSNSDRIVPLSPEIQKQWQACKSPESKFLNNRKNATPTSIGFVIHQSKRDSLDENMRLAAASSKALIKAIEQFVKSKMFSKFVLDQFKVHLGVAVKRSPPTKALKKPLDSIIAAHSKEIISSARASALAIAEKLRAPKVLSYVNLEDALQITEGITREEIERELNA